MHVLRIDAMHGCGQPCRQACTARLAAYLSGNCMHRLLLPDKQPVTVTVLASSVAQEQVIIDRAAPSSTGRSAARVAAQACAWREGLQARP